MFIDTHCHLDFPEFNKDKEEVIRRSYDNGIGYIINIGSSLKGSADSVQLAKEHPSIYAACGIHPYEADKINESDKEELSKLLKSDKVVAIGEIGLDYYRNYSAHPSQQVLFVSLLKLAKDTGLPVVIHTRGAEKDTLDILKDALPLKAVVHCFSGDKDFLEECLVLGFFVSYTCNITYKKAEGLRETVKITPLDRLMLETDCPFLPPEGLRGKRNEPIYVKRLAEEIAGIKNTSINEVEQCTTFNAKEFFKISP